MNKRRRSRQGKLRRNHPNCMHRKLCTFESFTNQIGIFDLLVPSINAFRGQGPEVGGHGIRNQMKSKII
ncbi:MAG TPA: hypothetical protein DCY53_11055 [Desulfobacteraceae bacterium]|nr:hypothetical protein [Desulfobacteraceae bacterium]